MEHYLGEKLKKLRESRGWTQADLAKRLNKAVSTISGYESDLEPIGKNDSYNTFATPSCDFHNT